MFLYKYLSEYQSASSVSTGSISIGLLREQFQQFQVVATFHVWH